MSENVDPDLTELRAALAEAARIEDLAERSLEVVAVVEAAGAPQVLRRAGLVRDEPSGRQRHYHLTAEPLAEVGEWLHPFERYWRDRLRTLADMLEDQEPMPQASPATLSLDQFIDASPEKVWQALTEPELHARWWAAGDIAPIVGHRFKLQMPPSWGLIDCEILEVEPNERLVYTFNDNWTLTWRLVAEGHGTRLLLDHSGFDLDDPRGREAFERMGPGWEHKILPALAAVAAELDD